MESLLPPVAVGVYVAWLGWWKSSSTSRPRSVAISARREDHEVIDATMVATAPPAYRPAMAMSRSMPVSESTAAAVSSSASPSSRCAKVSG